MNDTKKLKILIIHTRYQFFGGEDSVVDQEIELLKKNYDVDTIFFQNHSGIKGATQFLFSIWNQKSSKLVKKKILTFKPDLVHIHNWHFASGPLMIRSISKLKVQIILTLHNYRLLCPSAILLNNQNIFLDSLYQNFPFSAIKNKVYRNSYIQTFWLAFVVWFHRKIGTWKKVNKYICLTQNSIDLFNKSNQDIPQERFTVKPNFTTKLDVVNDDLHVEKEKCFLFIGRLSKEKGIDVLLKAFDKLPFLLKIAGDGPLKPQVIKKANSANNIKYLGSLSKNEIAMELQKAEAIIFSSVWFETFGMVIVEAFSYKCAVISSNIGAPLTIVEDGKNGLQFKYGSSEAIIDAVNKWMKFSTKEKERIRFEGYESYRRLYSKEKQHQHFERIINNLLINKG